VKRSDYISLFHTHTPTTYRSVGRVVGPSLVDNTAHSTANVAGIVYDYIVTNNSIPAGHPLNSSALRSSSGPNERKPLNYKRYTSMKKILLAFLFVFIISTIIFYYKTNNKSMESKINTNSVDRKDAIKSIEPGQNTVNSQILKEEYSDSINSSRDIEYIGDVSPEIAKKAIDICMVALKSKVNIPEGKPSITVNGDNLIIRFPTKKNETAGGIHMGPDYSAEVTLDVKTWKVINILGEADSVF